MRVRGDVEGGWSGGACEVNEHDVYRFLAELRGRRRNTGAMCSRGYDERGGLTHNIPKQLPAIMPAILVDRALGNTPLENPPSG